MPTEVIVQSDPTGWIAFAAAGAAVLILLLLYFRKASPTGPFSPFFQAKSKNKEGGGDKAGRYAVLILLRPESRLIEIEVAKRAGGILIRKSGNEVHLTRPNSLWFLAGVPVAFVWANNWRVINPSAATATVEYAGGKKCTTRDQIVDALEADTEHDDIEIPYGTIVPFAEMVAFNDDLSPADVDSIAQWLVNESKKKSSLLDLLKNPMVIIGLVIAAFAVFLLFGMR